MTDPRIAGNAIVARFVSIVVVVLIASQIIKVATTVVKGALGFGVNVRFVGPVIATD